MPAARKPRLIGAIADLSLSVACTDEHADDRREHADRTGAEREQRTDRPQLRACPGRSPGTRARRG